MGKVNSSFKNMSTQNASRFNLKRFCINLYTFLIVFCLGVFTFEKSAQAWKLEQQWTRLVNSGISYYHFRLRFNTGLVHIYVLEVNPNKGYSLRPIIANDTIGTLAPVDSLAKRASAIAAINGGFFDTQGAHLPVGLIKINYTTVFEQFLPRPVLSISVDGKVHFELFSLRSYIKISRIGLTIPLNGYNRARKSGEVIAYTKEFGRRTKTNIWGKELILRRVSPYILSKGEMNLLGEKYVIETEELNNSPIPEDGLVISFHASKLKDIQKDLSSLARGDEVEIVTQLPDGWEKYPHLLGGGPMLIKDGKSVLNYKDEKFSSFMNRAHARTAVGETMDGKIVLIVVDKGNKSYSSGATWEQLTQVGIELLNLKNLMGFDGGGSSTMFIQGQVVNKPSSGVPRAVANILAVVPIERVVSK